jgi:hypothetical protein
MDPFYFPTRENHASLSCSPTDTVGSLETAMSTPEGEAPLTASPPSSLMPAPDSVEKSPKKYERRTHRRSEFVLIG